MFITEFRNQFDQWQVFHAFRSKEKASLDAGSSGRVIEVCEASAYGALKAENQRLRAALEELYIPYSAKGPGGKMPRFPDVIIREDLASGVEGLKITLAALQRNFDTLDKRAQLDIGYRNTQIVTLREKLKLAREALEFYSNHGSRVLMSKDMQPENGRIAREALAQLGDEK